MKSASASPRHNQNSSPLAVARSVTLRTLRERANLTDHYFVHEIKRPCHLSSVILVVFLIVRFPRRCVHFASILANMMTTRSKNPSSFRPSPREHIAAHDQSLHERFRAGADIETLLAQRAACVDQCILGLWNAVNWPDSASRALGLFAVGGYGRGELHPHSDVDVLVVSETDIAPFAEDIEQFVRSLWNLGLEIGHGVRTLEECRSAAAADLTIATSLLERRQLAGAPELDQQLGNLFAYDEIWPQAKFFRAKVDEQEKRHKHYDNVSYGLEPDVKSSPGGLRDVHTIDWIMRRSFGLQRRENAASRGFIEHDDAESLSASHTFLKRVRWGLHMIVGRKQEQLRFEYQHELADLFGYPGNNIKARIEAFMHDYYKHVQALVGVSDLLLQQFDEAILRVHAAPVIRPLNDRFVIHDEYLAVKDEDVFEKQPWAMMEMMVVLAHRPDIGGVRASTIRLVRQAVKQVDDAFRSSPRVAFLFLQLLRSPYTLVSQLNRMRRYGLLQRYIPEFGDVVGQMQHDLFHIYTVDAHTLQLIRNLRRFRYRSAREKFPVAAHCIKRLRRLEPLYIAGLFHDLGKGKDGDHSELGARDVVLFCKRLGLSAEQAELAEWLVRQHLAMSRVSQGEDLSDPEVIRAFAQFVGNRTRLDYLYTLTVADITATDPSLWNTWRAALMSQLYTETRKVLRRGSDVSPGRAEKVRDAQRLALKRLEKNGMNADMAARIWDDPPDEFFLVHSPRHIAEFTELLGQRDCEDQPLVAVRDAPRQLEGEGATLVFVATRDTPELMLLTLARLSLMGLSIHAAWLSNTRGGMRFATYIVLDEEKGYLGRSKRRFTAITEELVTALQTPQSKTQVDEAVAKISARRPRRELQYFHVPVKVQFDEDDGLEASSLQIECRERPGVLTLIVRILVGHDLTIRSARVSTLGERVEDSFIVTQADGAPVSGSERQNALAESIRKQLVEAGCER